MAPFGKSNMPLLAPPVLTKGTTSAPRSKAIFASFATPGPPSKVTYTSPTSAISCPFSTWSRPASRSEPRPKPLAVPFCTKCQCWCLDPEEEELVPAKLCCTPGMPPVTKATPAGGRAMKRASATRRMSSSVSWHEHFVPPSTQTSTPLRSAARALRAAQHADQHPAPVGGGAHDPPEFERGRLQLRGGRRSRRCLNDIAACHEVHKLFVLDAAVLRGVDCVEEQPDLGLAERRLARGRAALEQCADLREAQGACSTCAVSRPGAATSAETIGWKRLHRPLQSRLEKRWIAQVWAGA
mmetsp:Transcript_93220/g.300073  ORF Transcript_93220/g.300073 Transcript_93220/m.300073 type:complete len:297 (-) Transcript_93220:7-897(-)